MQPEDHPEGLDRDVAAQARPVGRDRTLRNALQEISTLLSVEAELIRQ